jgi:hypothetical protein
MRTSAVPFAFEDKNKTVEEVVFIFVHAARYQSSVVVDFTSDMSLQSC